jgi:hypothetical protein
MHPVTYSEANPPARREWKLRDFLIHACHCTSISTRWKLERRLILVRQFPCAVNYWEAFRASGTRMIIFAPAR